MVIKKMKKIVLFGILGMLLIANLATGSMTSEDEETTKVKDTLINSWIEITNPVDDSYVFFPFTIKVECSQDIDKVKYYCYADWNGNGKYYLKIGESNNPPFTFEVDLNIGLGEIIEIHAKGFERQPNGQYKTVANSEQIQLVIGSLRPEKPTITGPDHAGIYTEVEFKFVTTDPEGDDVYYIIDWGKPFLLIEEYGPYESGKEITLHQQYKERRYYTIRCRAKDEIGAKSGWREHLIQIKIIDGIPEDQSTSSSNQQSQSQSTPLNLI